MGEDEAGEQQEAQQQQMQQLYQRKMQALQLDMQKKDILRRMLSEKAYERMMNVRLSNPELYDKVVNSIAYVAQSGRQMEGKISEEQIYSLLQKMTQKRETTIEFRSK